MTCTVCGANAGLLFNTLIRNKYQGEFYWCGTCGFLFAGNPVWLSEAYRESINLSDTGIIQRNLYLSRLTAAVIYFFFNRNGSFLDYAGGYGIFTRMMRDTGFNFYWTDPYTANIFAKGFELPEKTTGLELVTAFEVFEHLPDPAEEINKIFSYSDNLLFSTELLPYPVPKPGTWWYYGFEHGQHISFYSEKTLRYIAAKHDLNFRSTGGLHLLTSKKISPLLLKLVSFIPKADMFTLIRKMLKSKTWDDHMQLKNKGM